MGANAVAHCLSTLFVSKRFQDSSRGPFQDHSMSLFHHNSWVSLQDPSRPLLQDLSRSLLQDLSMGLLQDSPRGLLQDLGWDAGAGGDAVSGAYVGVDARADS